MNKSCYMLICLFALSACGPYRLSLNDTVLYTPPILFSDFQVADPALQRCLMQTIRDKKITAAQQLTKINCTHAGIINLQGIELFDALETIDISHNSIENLLPLTKSSAVTRLYANHNKIRQIAPLINMKSLKVLHVLDNPAIDCTQIHQFNKQWTGMLEAPKRCSEQK